MSEVAFTFSGDTDGGERGRMLARDLAVSGSKVTLVLISLREI